MYCVRDKERLLNLNDQGQDNDATHQVKQFEVVVKV